MLNFATVTSALETLLNANLTGYSINRNAPRNTDPNVPARQQNGWINIQRNKLNYVGYSTGPQPWLGTPSIRVEIQVSSRESGSDAEDMLQSAEAEVLSVIAADKNIGGTVAIIKGFDISYEYNDSTEIYHHAAIITINMEVRA